MEYFYVVLFTIIINIPFGYLRGDKKRFSVLWFVYIHLPVPFVIFFREKMAVELSWGFAPFFFGSYLLGQWLGKLFFRYQRKRDRSSGKL
jgi:FtsH-binding integral membrane protein